MRSYRWVLLLLFTLLIVPLPAFADVNNVVRIDGGDPRSPHDLPRLLSAEEVAKIQRLQTTSTRWSIVSPVSPDDRRVLVLNSKEVGLLNVADGTSHALSLAALGPLMPLGLLSSSAQGFQWLDQSVLATLAVNMAAQGPADAFQVLLWNVDTGEVRGAPLGLSPNAVPVSLSPDGHTVLAQETELRPDAGGMYSLASPFKTPSGDAVAAATPAQVAAALASAPQLRPFLPFASGGSTYHTMQVAQTMLHLKLIDVASGKARDLAALDPGAVPGPASWRPDGAELAMTINGIYDAGQARASGKPVLDGALISEEIYRDLTGNLPPAINPLLQRNELRIFNLASGESRSLRAAESGGDLFANAIWAPDNNTLLVRMSAPSRPAGRTYPAYHFFIANRGYYRFYSRDLHETGRVEASELSAPTTNGAVFASPDEVIFSGLAGTNLHPYYYNRVSGEFRDIADRAGSYTAIRSARASRQLLFIHSGFSSPPEIYRMGWDGSAIAQLTWANDELRRYSQTREYPVSFTLRSGKRWAGTLILPAEVSFPPKNVPIVVWEEGGPGGSMYGWWTASAERPFALLPNFGIGMLVVPVSGREGNGPTAQQALVDNANFGQIDIDEQAEISRQMISRGWTSAAKLGIMGFSYGGYFTWQSVVRHPDLYAAANAQSALIDLLNEWQGGYPGATAALEGLPPWVAGAEYMRDSPSYNAAQVKAAVLSFHGDMDYLPITLNENLHLQLVNQGTPARMVQLFGSGHGIDRMDYQLYAIQEQISWFRSYLR